MKKAPVSPVMMNSVKKDILITFNDDELDEILAFSEKGGYPTIQEAIIAAVRSCSNKVA